MIFVGDSSNNPKKMISGMVGVNGEAREILGVYVGDETGKAKLVYPAGLSKVQFVPIYCEMGRDLDDEGFSFESNDWNNINTYGGYTINGNTLYVDASTPHYVMLIYRMVAVTDSGMKMDLSEYSKITKSTFSINVTLGKESYPGSNPFNSNKVYIFNVNHQPSWAASPMTATYEYTASQMLPTFSGTFAGVPLTFKGTFLLNRCESSPDGWGTARNRMSINDLKCNGQAVPFEWVSR